MLAFAFIVLCGFSSCKTTHDVEYLERVVYKETHDTLRLEIHDSIYNEVIQKGDTIYNTKYVEKTKWKDRVVEKHDTTTVVDIQKETVEVKYIPKWCYYCLGACLIALLFAIFKVARWLRLI